jgi:energy-coupling factor transporter ATP-binding protein EcfA2
LRRTAPRILIDGRSGSGKTELARAIAATWPEAQLVRLDDVYPGWGGLEEASAHVHDELFAHARWRRWDWGSGAPAEWHTIDPELPIIVEGCGSLSRANRAAATFGVWVELDDAERKRRALDRDGDTYAPHWDAWAELESIFIAHENPAALADAVVDGNDVFADVAKWRALLDPARVAQ